MTKDVYINCIVHDVELYLEKKQEQEEQDQETLEKLIQLQLVNKETNKSKRAVMHESQ